MDHLPALLVATKLERAIFFSLSRPYPPGGAVDLSPIKNFPRQRRLSECKDDTPVNVNSTDRTALLDSLSGIRSILSESESVRIVRLFKSNDDAIRLLREYYEAVSVVQRDTPEAIRKIIDAHCFWRVARLSRRKGCRVCRAQKARLHSLRRGMQASLCKRYNDNPQATVFLRKNIRSGQ